MNHVWCKSISSIEKKISERSLDFLKNLCSNSQTIFSCEKCLTNFSNLYYKYQQKSENPLKQIIIDYAQKCCGLNNENLQNLRDFLQSLRKYPFRLFLKDETFYNCIKLKIDYLIYNQIVLQWNDKNGVLLLFSDCSELRYYVSVCFINIYKQISIPKSVFNILSKGLEDNKTNEMLELLMNGFISLMKSTQFKHSNEFQSFINALFKIQCDIYIDSLPLYSMKFLLTCSYFEPSTYSTLLRTEFIGEDVSMRCLSMLCDGNITPSAAAIYEMLKTKTINENLFYNEVINQFSSKRDSIMNGIFAVTFISIIDSWSRNNLNEFLFPRKLIDYAQHRGISILLFGDNSNKYSFNEIYKEIQSIKQKCDSGVDNRNPYQLLGEYFITLESKTNIKVYRDVLLNLLTAMSIYAIKSTAKEYQYKIIKDLYNNLTAPYINKYPIINDEELYKALFKFHSCFNYHLDIEEVCYKCQLLGSAKTELVFNTLIQGIKDEWIHDSNESSVMVIRLIHLSAFISNYLKIHINDIYLVNEYLNVVKQDLYLHSINHFNDHVSASIPAFRIFVKYLTSEKREILFASLQQFTVKFMYKFTPKDLSDFNDLFEEGDSGSSSSSLSPEQYKIKMIDNTIEHDQHLMVLNNLEGSNINYYFDNIFTCEKCLECYRKLPIEIQQNPLIATSLKHVLCSKDVDLINRCFDSLYIFPIHILVKSTVQDYMKSGIRTLENNNYVAKWKNKETGMYIACHNQSLREYALMVTNIKEIDYSGLYGLIDILQDAESPYRNLYPVNNIWTCLGYLFSSLHNPYPVTFIDLLMKCLTLLSSPVTKLMCLSSCFFTSCCIISSWYNEATFQTPEFKRMIGKGLLFYIHPANHSQFPFIVHRLNLALDTQYYSINELFDTLFNNLSQYQRDVSTTMLCLFIWDFVKYLLIQYNKPIDVIRESTELYKALQVYEPTEENKILFFSLKETINQIWFDLFYVYETYSLLLNNDAAKELFARTLGITVIRSLSIRDNLLREKVLSVFYSVVLLSIQKSCYVNYYKGIQTIQENTHEIYLKFIKCFIIEVKASFPQIFYDKMNLQTILMTYLYERNTHIASTIGDRIIVIDDQETHDAHHKIQLLIETWVNSMYEIWYTYDLDQYFALHSRAIDILLQILEKNTKIVHAAHMNYLYEFLCQCFEFPLITAMEKWIEVHLKLFEQIKQYMTEKQQNSIIDLVKEKKKVWKNKFQITLA